MVDADFAADRTIHLRQQRCRNLDKSNSPLISCGDITGEITDHTSAQCDDGR